MNFIIKIILFYHLLKVFFCKKYNLTLPVSIFDNKNTYNITLPVNITYFDKNKFNISIPLNKNKFNISPPLKSSPPSLNKNIFISPPLNNSNISTSKYISNYFNWNKCNKNQKQQAKCLIKKGECIQRRHLFRKIIIMCLCYKNFSGLRCETEDISTFAVNNEKHKYDTTSTLVTKDNFKISITELIILLTSIISYIIYKIKINKKYYHISNKLEEIEKTEEEIEKTELNSFS